MNDTVITQPPVNVSNFDGLLVLLRGNSKKSKKVDLKTTIFLTHRPASHPLGYSPLVSQFPFVSTVDKLDSWLDPNFTTLPEHQLAYLSNYIKDYLSRDDTPLMRISQDEERKFIFEITFPQSGYDTITGRIKNGDHLRFTHLFLFIDELFNYQNIIGSELIED